LPESEGAAPALACYLCSNNHPSIHLSGMYTNLFSPRFLACLLASDCAPHPLNPGYTRRILATCYQTSTYRSWPLYIRSWPVFWPVYYHAHTRVNRDN